MCIRDRPSGPCTWLTLGAPWVGMPAIQPPSVKSCRFLHSSAKITPKKSILIMLQCILSLSKYLVLKRQICSTFTQKSHLIFFQCLHFFPEAPLCHLLFIPPMTPFGDIRGAFFQHCGKPQSSSLTWE